jgi:PqqD family protein of HPr-rel-A system
MEAALPVTFRRDPTLPFQTLDDEVIVVDPKTREVHLLNETAARIWGMLADPRSIAELVATLEEEYQGDAEDIRQEVEAFVGDMSRKGLCAAISGVER